MLHDFRLLIQLEIKRFADTLRYIMRLLGFEDMQSRAVRIYAAFFWLGWVAVMWSYLIDSVFQLSARVSRETIVALTPLIPLAIFALQMLYLVQLFRDPPLKFNAADLHYVAPSPLSRGSITAIRFAATLLFPAIALSLVGALVAMFLTRQFNGVNTGMIGLQAFGVSLLLGYFSSALCWCIALFKQTQPSRAAKRLFWPIIPLLIAAAALIPDGMLWPGQLWLHAIQGGSVGLSLALLGVVLILAIILLYGVGNRLHMTRVIVDSQMYARIQRLGPFGRVMASDVIARIRMQTQLAQKRVLLKWMPRAWVGTNALIGQSYVSLMRLSPETSVRLFFSGGVLVSAVYLLVGISGSPPLQAWLIVYVLLIQLRPRDVMRMFRSHTEQSFMRQFMPLDNLRLFAASIAIPFALTGLGMAAFFVTQQRIDPFIGSLLALNGLLALCLCSALEYVKLTRLQLPRIAYQYSVLAVLILIVLAGYFMRSLSGALMAAVIVNSILMWLIGQSEVM